MDWIRRAWPHTLRRRLLCCFVLLLAAWVLTAAPRYREVTAWHARSAPPHSDALAPAAPTAPADSEEASTHEAGPDERAQSTAAPGISDDRASFRDEAAVVAQIVQERTCRYTPRVCMEASFRAELLAFARRTALRCAEAQPAAAVWPMPAAHHTRKRMRQRIDFPDSVQLLGRKPRR